MVVITAAMGLSGTAGAIDLAADASMAKNRQLRAQLLSRGGSAMGHGLWDATLRFRRGTALLRWRFDLPDARPRPTAIHIHGRTRTGKSVRVPLCSPPPCREGRYIVKTLLRGEDGLVVVLDRRAWIDVHFGGSKKAAFQGRILFLAPASQG